METRLFGVWPNHCQDGYVGLPRPSAPAQMTSKSCGWGGRDPISLLLNLGANPVLITLPLSNSDGPVGVCAAYVPSLVSSSRWNYPLGETPQALSPTPPATAEEVSSEASESHWLVPGVWTCQIIHPFSPSLHFTLSTNIHRWRYLEHKGMFLMCVCVFDLVYLKSSESIRLSAPWQF